MEAIIKCFVIACGITILLVAAKLGNLFQIEWVWVIAPIWVPIALAFGLWFIGAFVRGFLYLTGGS